MSKIFLFILLFLFSCNGIKEKRYFERKATYSNQYYKDNIDVAFGWRPSQHYITLKFLDTLKPDSVSINANTNYNLVKNFINKSINDTIIVFYCKHIDEKGVLIFTEIINMK